MTTTVKGSNRGRIFINDEFEDPNFLALPRNRWLDIERAVQVKLPNEARKLLMEITEEYATTLRPKTSMEATTSILDSIDQWRRQTEALRRKIWTSPTTTFVNASPDRSISDIVGSYIEEDPSQVQQKYILAELDRFLDCAAAVARNTHQTIATNNFNVKPDSYLWFAWATAVSLVLRKNGVRMRHPSRKKLDPGYVKALEILQEALPKALQRRKGEALRKAALAAFKIARRYYSVKLPRTLLTKWGKGHVTYDPTGKRFFSFHPGFYPRFLQHVRKSTKGGSKREEALTSEISL